MSERRSGTNGHSTEFQVPTLAAWEAWWASVLAKTPVYRVPFDDERSWASTHEHSDRSIRLTEKGWSE